MNRFQAQRHVIFYLVVSICNVCSTKAAQIAASSGSFTDVSSAISKATFGDIVQIPAGTWTWTNANLTVSGITLQGAGTNATFIQDGLPANPYTPFFLLNCVTAANTLTRVTGITFQDVGGGTINYHGKIGFNSVAAGASSAYRLDHCAFIGLQGIVVAPEGAGVGLIDHDYFQFSDEAINSGWQIGSDNGDTSYATPPAYGTTNVLCIENNFFQGMGDSHALYDGSLGARVTVRYNYCTNAVFSNHGNDTSQRERSVREYEVYENSFNFSYYDIQPFTFRGGTGVVFSNTITGPVGFNYMFSYRSVEPNFWGGAAGFSQWDSNSVSVVAAGTIASSSGTTVVISGANWTVNQWVGYSIVDTNGSWSSVVAYPPYGIIVANTTNTLTIGAPKDYAPVFNNGDAVQFYYCYPAIDQVGRGSGDLVVDTGNWPSIITINNAFGYAAWPRQAVEMLYGWGNTLNGNPVGISSGFPNIAEGRDFTNGIAKPDYTPLVYPHPLDVSDKKLSPPSGLSAH
jgi:hypothetical protein